MARLAVDTNVLAIANRRHHTVSEACVASCAAKLLEIRRSHVVLVDAGQQIMAEYRDYAHAGGRPGLGDAFFKWLWDNRANPRACQEVVLTPLPDDQGDFEEFPESLRTVGFDRNDRKFVAVALTGADHPIVVNGVDRGYAVHYNALMVEGVDVEFLCPAECAPNGDARDRQSSTGTT